MALRRHRILFLAGALAALLAGNALAQSNALPAYSITAELDPHTSTIVGKAVIRLPRTFLSHDSSIFVQRDTTLTITEARDAAGRVLKVADVEGSDARQINIAPGAAERVATITLSFRKHAQLKNGLGYMLYDASGPASYWYPRLSGDGVVAKEYADYTVDLTYPDTLEAMTTGVRTELRAASSNTRRLQSSAHDVQAVILALGSRFRVTTATRAGVQINQFDRIDPDSALGDVVKPVGDAIEWYVKTYGFFPHDFIGIVPGYTRAIGGSPMPGVFFIHRGYRQPAFLRAMTAHELGHYYWGQNVLGEDRAGSLSWLMLGNSIWGDQLYMAKSRGISLDTEWHTPDIFNMPERFLTAQVSNTEQRLGLTDAEQKAIDADYNGMIFHAKAAMGINLLARRLGEARFIEVQKSILTTYHHRTLTPDEFATRMEAAGVTGAREWLHAWMRGDARLGYEVASIERVANSTAHKYRVIVNRTGTIAYPVELMITDAANDTIRRTLNGTSADTIEEVLSADIGTVVLDPAGALPMWGSGSPLVEGSLARAMLIAGNGEAAIELATRQVTRVPADTLTRAALIVRLSELGRYSQAIQTMSRGELDCTTRATCLATIAYARALSATGDSAKARRILETARSVAPFAGAFRQWDAASKAAGQ